MRKKIRCWMSSIIGAMLCALVMVVGFAAAPPAHRNGTKQQTNPPRA